MASKQPTSPQAPRRRGLTPFLAALAVAAVSAAVYAPALPSLTGPAHANKPYASFDEFYPFYQREHSRTETRAMHVAGTAVVLFLMLRAPALAAAAAVAGSVGFLLSGLLRGMPNGIVEGTTLVTVFLLVALPAGFAGCMRDVAVNGEYVDFTASIATVTATMLACDAVVV